MKTDSMSTVSATKFTTKTMQGQIDCYRIDLVGGGDVVIRKVLLEDEDRVRFRPRPPGSAFCEA